MRRTLVAGAGGFIGRHCLPLLRHAGHEVHAVTRGVGPPLISRGNRLMDLRTLLTALTVNRRVMEDRLTGFSPAPIGYHRPCGLGPAIEEVIRA